jgi:ribonuclease T
LDHFTFESGILMSSKITNNERNAPSQASLDQANNIKAKAEKSYMASRFRGYMPVVIDVETAGFNANTDALLEIAAVTLKFDENDNLVADEKMSFNVEPFEGANLEVAALEFTGIDPSDPERNALDEGDALREIFKMIRKQQKAAGCKRSILVGHNANFDHNFVMAAANRASLKRNPFHPFSVFDTGSMAALVLGETVLAKSCINAGIEFDNHQAHSALYDTEKTAELFCFMVNKVKKLGGWPLAE